MSGLTPASAAPVGEQQNDADDRQHEADRAGQGVAVSRSDHVGDQTDKQKNRPRGHGRQATGRKFPACLYAFSGDAPDTAGEVIERALGSRDPSLRLSAEWTRTLRRLYMEAIEDLVRTVNTEITQGRL